MACRDDLLDTIARRGQGATAFVLARLNVGCVNQIRILGQIVEYRSKLSESGNGEREGATITGQGQGEARLPATVDQTQAQITLGHIARLPYAAVIKANEIGTLSGKPTGKNFVPLELGRELLGQVVKLALQLIFSTEDVDVCEHARRCGMADVDRLIRLALAAKLGAMNLEASGVADGF